MTRVYLGAAIFDVWCFGVGCKGYRRWLASVHFSFPFFQVSMLRTGSFQKEFVGVQGCSLFQDIPEICTVKGKDEKFICMQNVIKDH